jgi:hypothetical protein
MGSVYPWNAKQMLSVLRDTGARMDNAERLQNAVKRTPVRKGIYVKTEDV